MQFLSPLAAQSALIHLRGYTLLGKSMEISFSKHTYISNHALSTEKCVSLSPSSSSSLRAQPHSLLTCCLLVCCERSPLVKEYNHLPNRFTGKAATSLGKHVYSPTKILHLSNFEETVTIEVGGCALLLLSRTACIAPDAVTQDT